MQKIILHIFFIAGIFSVSCSRKAGVVIFYDELSPQVSYGVSKLSEKLENSGFTVVTNDSTSGFSRYIHILKITDNTLRMHMDVPVQKLGDINGDGYRIFLQDDRIYVIGREDRGCLYGLLDIARQASLDGDLDGIEEKKVNPALSFRAIKFNLPWSPYRPGPATDVHLETCRDTTYWESFLDMMVWNRYNALTLWSKHLFPYMIQLEKYPEATPFSQLELQEWRYFWKTLFKMARDRGIETYIVNWNIVVSPEFAEHHGIKVHDDRSELVIDYTRESVKQLIDEYENLTGLGVTLADWMGNWGDNRMTPREREDWIEDTFIEGMNQANRKIKFIHRAVLAGDPQEMRRVIDHADLEDPAIVEVKFNWSHGHSTPKLSITHANDQGAIMQNFWDPEPENYYISWMIRNEDFFVLRWGNPEFIRNHIAINNKSYVDGYFVGSEGYIPAKDYSHIEGPDKTWLYAFQKQWMFYYLWGRLMYDPEESDVSLSRIFERKYPGIDALKMLKSYSLASKVPLYLASFIKGTWDFTLYSEGFLAPWILGYDDQKSPFISLEELMFHETLDPGYVNIEQFCQGIMNDRTFEDELFTPLQVAAHIENDCSEALRYIQELRSESKDRTLISEIDDLETWCHLGYYLSDKIRAGVATRLYQLNGKPEKKHEALNLLNSCKDHWKRIVHLTENRYAPMPYVSFGHHEPRWPDFNTFHWRNFMNDVEADIEFVDQLD